MQIISSQSWIGGLEDAQDM